MPGKARPYKKQISKKRIVQQDKSGYRTAWTESMQWYAVRAMDPRDLITGPIEMICCFFMASRKKMWFDNVPDDDNLAYLVSNALSGIVYRDDRQRVDSRVTKRIASGVPPGVYIEINELEIYPEDWSDHTDRALTVIRAQEMLEQGR